MMESGPETVSTNGRIQAREMMKMTYGDSFSRSRRGLPKIDTFVERLGR